MHIRHLKLHTSVLEAQRAFYTGALELPLLERSDVAFAVRVGESRLEFVASSAPAHYHFAFNVASDALERAKVWLEARTPLLIGADLDEQGQTVFYSESWDAHMVYFRDPAGNIGELIARHTLPAALEGVFGASGLGNVSEMGVVVPDVRAGVERLREFFGLNLYRRPPGEAFAALGTETGLFIVVREGRLWFPDLTQTARPAPFEAQIVLEGGERVWLNERLEHL